MAVASAKPGCVERAREGEILSKLKSLDFSHDPKNRNKIVRYMHHYGSNTDQKTIVAKTKLDRCSCRIRECFCIRLPSDGHVPIPDCCLIAGSIWEYFDDGNVCPVSSCTWLLCVFLRGYQRITTRCSQRKDCQNLKDFYWVPTTKGCIHM